MKTSFTYYPSHNFKQTVLSKTSDINKQRYKYFFICILTILFLSAKAQIINLPISKANIQLFNGNIFAAGLSTQDKKTSLLIYKIDFKLNKTDSISIGLGKNSADDFLQITSDTLHEFLNIYIQQKEKKLVNIMRLNKFFKKIAFIEDIDIVRLNSVSTFENEFYYYRSNFYTIKSVKDTSGKQFYLNKYTLKSNLKNFEYDTKWQYPFERKNINSIHIVFADNSIVLVYANVINSTKKGQWLLKINANTGLLIRATKMNDKNDNSYYSFGKLLFDTLNKHIYIHGQKFTEAEINQHENKLNITGKAPVTIYLSMIDSVGELQSKNEFKIPIIDPKGVVNKTPVHYLIKPNAISKDKEGHLFIESDIFKSSSTRFCYNYCNSTILKLLKNEDKLLLEKNSVSSNLLIEKYYFNNDKLDMNGKLCVDSITDFEKLFYNTPTFNVKAAYKLNETNNPVWLLKKTDIKKNVQNYSFSSPVKKIYQLTTIKDINKSESPTLLYLSKNGFIISNQISTDNFQLQLFNW